jgi:hypothetical protein
MIVVVMVLAIMMLIVLVMLISMLWSAVVVDRVIVVLSYRRSTKRFACSILRTQGALGEESTYGAPDSHQSSLLFAH